MSAIPESISPEALRLEADRREHRAIEAKERALLDRLIDYMGSLLELEREAREVGQHGHLSIPRVQAMKSILAVKGTLESEAIWAHNNDRDRGAVEPVVIPEEILRYVRRERLQGWEHVWRERR